MNLNISKYIFSFCIIVLGFQMAFSQNNSVYDTITVQGKFNPTLSDANKINFNAQILDPNAAMPTTKYFKVSKPLRVSYTPKEIKPAKFKGPKTLEPLQKGLAVVGFGNYLSPYAEFFYNTTRSRKHNSGLHLKHHSAWGGMDSVVNPNFNENLVNIYTTQYYKGYTGTANVVYHTNSFNLYGVPDSISSLIDIDSLRQNLSTIGVSAGVEKIYNVHKVNYGIGLNYQYWFDKLGSGEHSAGLTAKVFKEVDFTPVIKYHNIGLKADVNYLQQSLIDSSSSFQVLSKITPYTTASIKEFDFDVGIGVNLTSDSATNAFVRPIIRVKLELIENVAHAFAGIKGGVIVQSLDQITMVNPFFNTNASFVNTFENYNLYGGFVTGIGKNLDFTAKVSTANYDNYMFFVTDTSHSLGNMFTYVTDDDVSIFSLNGQLAFHAKEKIRAVVAAGYYNYSPTIQQAAWHKPAFDASITMSYNLRNKIIARAGIYTFGKMQAREFDDLNNEIVTDLTAPFDLNLGVEYRFSKSLSAFANFNNVTAQRYSYWYNYPNQRFNMMAGVKYGL